MRGGARLLGHPLHPLLSDSPLALLPTALLWQVVGLFTGQPFWWRFAFWSAALGLAAAVPTACAGLFDYAALEEGHPAEATATAHLLVMSVAVTCSGLSLIWLRPNAAPAANGALLSVICSGLGLLGLAVGGWLGGELVFTHGIGSQKEGEPL